MSPGPGQYCGEKQKTGDLKFSIGAKLNFKTSQEVPGPGTYNRYNNHSIASTKFGTGQRESLEGKNKKSPGPGQHQPDFMIVK